MDVLLNDGLDREGIALFEDAGIRVDIERRSLDVLIQDIIKFDALVVRSATKVTRDVIEAGAGKLLVIGRAGVGYDNIDVKAASEKGIVVKYAPHGNTNAVAEMAFGLMLAVTRKIPQAHQLLVDGKWIRKSFEGYELRHKTLGIIGCGRVGQRLVELAMGFDMRAIGYDPFPRPDSRIEYKSMEEVLSQADYISIHTGGTEKIIGVREISRMKPTAYLINTSRGPNVDEEALYYALKRREIAGAAFDVYAVEPEEGGEFVNRLRELDNVVLSPHLGASTTEAQRNTSIEIASRVIDHLFRGDFSYAVNAEERVEAEKPVNPLHVFHQDVPGTFGEIYGVLSEYGINVRENPSRSFKEAGGVKTVWLLHQSVPQDALGRLNKLDVVHWARVLEPQVIP